MCTSIVIGKDATVDGSVILAANNDWPGYAGRIKRVPRKEHKSGEMFTLVNGMEIPQVEVTYAHTHSSTAYTTGIKDDSWIEGINENQVAVSMDGVYAFKKIDDKGCGLEPDDLPWLILERASTAREGIEIVTKLIDEYGFRRSSIDGADGTITMAIADPDEGWWLELVPGGAYWVAKRVPDNMASCRPNCFGIQEVDLGDHTNFMVSKNLVEYAEKRGWYDSADGKFDFSKVYGVSEGFNEYGAEDDPVNSRRRWRIMSLFAGKELPEDEAIYEVVPDRKLSIKDVMSVLRDTLAGTQYDLLKSPEAGPYGNPFHLEYSPSVAQAGTVISMVTQLRNWLPNEIGGVMWTAYGNPCTSLYIPWYVGSSEIPREYSIAETRNYSNESAWWNFEEVCNLCHRRYCDAALKDVIPVWDDFEEQEFILQDTIEQTALKLYEKDNSITTGFLSMYSYCTAKKALELAVDLSNMLRGRYLVQTVMK